MKKTRPPLHPSQHPLYDEFLISYFWDNLSLPDISSAFLSKWKNRCFFHSDVLKGPPLLTPQILPHKQKLREDKVRYLGLLQSAFQHYMDKITDKLYAANPEILGKRQPIVFELSCNPKRPNGFEFFYQNPPKISTTLTDILTYSNEDSLAGSLAHELIHLSIFNQNNHMTITTKAEEATADILGTIVLARAGYSPLLSLDDFFKSSPEAAPVLKIIHSGKITGSLSDESLMGLYEAIDQGFTKPPPFLPKRKTFLNRSVHPHTAVRLLYMLRLHNELYDIGLVKEKEHPTAVPLDPSFTLFLQQHLNKKNLCFVRRQNVGSFISR